MLDDKYIALIDDYLDGNLNQEAKESIESELKENADLRDMMALMQLSREGIRHAGHKELISKIHQEFMDSTGLKEEKTKSFSIRPWWLGIAASISLLLLAGNFWIKSQADIFYSNHYLLYEVPTMRSGESSLDQVMKLYRDGDFQTVVSLVEKTSNHQAELFLAGISSLELENYKDAAYYLEKVQALNESGDQGEKLFQEESDYFLFLTYVQLRNFGKADIYYARISTNKNHAFRNNLTGLDRLRYLIIRLK